MLKKGQIIRVKKGIYVLSPDYGGRINKFILANVIYGPSYISFESALSYWGLIPERVKIVTSTTTKRNKIFKTPAGTFVYHYLNPLRYIYGYTREKYDDTSSILIAKKEKAVCDILYASQIHSLKAMEDFLFDDIRIDPVDLMDLDPDLLKIITEHYRNTSITLFYKWYKKYKNKRIQK